MNHASDIDRRIKRPPSIKRPLSKVPNYLSVKCFIRYLSSTATSIIGSRPPFCCCKFSIYWVFTSIKRPANYFSSEMVTDNMKVITDNNKNCNLISTIMTPINSDTLPSFTAARTLAYLSERQMTWSSRYNYELHNGKQQWRIILN